MSSDGLTKTVHLVVAARVTGSQVQIVDRHGRPLTDMIERSLLGKLFRDDNPYETKWRKTLVTQLCRIKPRKNAASVSQCEWLVKCKTLSASFRQRSQDIHRPKSRQRHEKYKTTTWEEAAKRLWEQGHNRMRNVTRSGWHRWSITVANNHNKRAGGRYART
jgi:hypothetical protein